MSSAKTARSSINGNGNAPPTTAADPRRAKVAQEHDQRYKELNKLWEEAEKDLAEIPHPRDVYFYYHTYQPDEFEHPEYACLDYLGFVRVEGGWRICYGSGDNDPDPRCRGISWKPITECTQDIRVETIPHLRKLRDMMLKVAEENVPTLDTAIADLRAALADR